VERHLDSRFDSVSVPRKWMPRHVADFGKRSITTDRRILFQMFVVFERKRSRAAAASEDITKRSPRQRMLNLQRGRRRPFDDRIFVRRSPRDVHGLFYCVCDGEIGTTGIRYASDVRLYVIVSGTALSKRLHCGCSSFLFIRRHGIVRKISSIGGGDLFTGRRRIVLSESGLRRSVHRRRGSRSTTATRRRRFRCPGS